MGNNDRHIYPLDEEDLHIVNGPTSGVDCPCKPRVEVVGSDLIVIHNSFNHREIVEEAIRIMNDHHDERDSAGSEILPDEDDPHGLVNLQELEDQERDNPFIW